MKEFSAQTGGRYTYADDLENLQDLALAFAQIFDDCDNFIVSGCEITSGAISAGYVFLNGKLRYFSGATGITSWPQYIYELNSTENVTYESGGSKIGRNIYGCAIAKSVPVKQDELTGKALQSITITSNGGLRMKDAFIGRYALLLNPASGSQTVDSIVNFVKAINAGSDITANKNVIIKSGTIKTEMSYDGSTFSVKYTGDSNNYQLSLIDGIGFRFYANGTLIATIGSSSITFSQPVSASKGIFGGLVLTGNQIYQGTANAVGEIGINVYGYNGDTTQFRNTHIGNGKGKIVFSITGSDGSANIYGVTKIDAGTTDGLILKANMLKENNSLTNAISWRDSANAVMARVGFISTTDQTFSISSSAYNISIAGHTTVNIGPAIMENGVLLSEKYATVTNLTEGLEKKANSSDVYTQTQANKKFAVKTEGLLQFVTSNVSEADCRSHIGAIGKSDLNSYAKLENYLSDMATDETKKQTIRNNIGAAGVGDFQSKLSDSGWKHIKDSLYVRQIGNIVCIQGSIKTVHSGTVFTIPNTISAPSHAVKYTIAFNNSRNWVCKIEAGQRACTVVYCNGSCGNSTQFSITYMV
nr:MAG TPA: hypothetical protein [Caudoviricetes sp.]